jgi:ABC-type uncharacterized transport system substrate-binding protein
MSVIARSAATKQSSLSLWLLDCFAALAMTMAMLFGTSPASAHPDVWVTSASELIYATDGSITGVRHAWTFDEMFSSYALDGVESKAKGVFTREELAPLAQVNVESLKEFGFFTFAIADGKKQKFLEPVDYYLEYKAPALVLHFTLPFKTPFKSKQLKLEVFDPTRFVEFSLQQEQPVTLVAAPAACKLDVQRPDTPSKARKPGELSEEDDDHSSHGAMVVNRITVDCP